jgi:hypothetical protein
MEGIEENMSSLNINHNINNDIEVITDTMNNINISNNKTIDNAMNISNDDTFGNIEWWINGIPNVNCKTVDDEDFVYCRLTLPNSIFKELSDSGMTSYTDYFDAFCCNNEEIFLPTENIIQISELFDNIFSKRLINFDIVNNLVISNNNIINDLMSEESYIHDYFTDYINDLFYGLNILTDMLIYYTNHFRDSNYYNMIGLLNNYCVIIIYLKFYFECNILDINEKIIIR